MRAIAAASSSRAGRVIGGIGLHHSSRKIPTAMDRRTLDLLAIDEDLDPDRVLDPPAGYAGVAIANARLYRQAQELATVEERARVARELHDSVSQRLFSMVYEARAAALRTGDGEARAALQRLEQGATTALNEMKALVYAVR